jgi:hypothetical protein
MSTFTSDCVARFAVQLSMGSMSACNEGRSDLLACFSFSLSSREIVLLVEKIEHRQLVVSHAFLGPAFLLGIETRSELD